MIVAQWHFFSWASGSETLFQQDNHSGMVFQITLTVISIMVQLPMVQKLEFN